MSNKEVATKNGRQRRTLPTPRIAFPKQLDILRAWASASGPGKKPVGLKDAAPLVKMAENTITLANPFFTDVGLLMRVDGGLIPSDEVSSFNHAYQWNPETASLKLAPVIEQTWFAAALVPRLTMGQITEGEAIALLSETAGAGKEYADQLHTLLEYVQAAGLIALENGTVRLVLSNLNRVPVGTSTTTTSTTTSAPPTTTLPPGDGKEHLAPRFSPVSTAFSKPTEGMINFHVSFRVDMQEMSGWSADRIGRFFSGIAEVLSAKGSIEENAASG